MRVKFDRIEAYFASSNRLSIVCELFKAKNLFLSSVDLRTRNHRKIEVAVIHLHLNISIFYWSLLGNCYQKEITTERKDNNFCWFLIFIEKRISPNTTRKNSRTAFNANLRMGWEDSSRGRLSMHHTRGRMSSNIAKKKDVAFLTWVWTHSLVFFPLWLLQYNRLQRCRLPFQQRRLTRQCVEIPVRWLQRQMGVEPPSSLSIGTIRPPRRPLVKLKQATKICRKPSIDFANNEW